MSDDERILTSRAPWMGQRVCVRCQKVSFGVDQQGVCPTCREEERTAVQEEIRRAEERLSRRKARR